MVFEIQIPTQAVVTFLVGLVSGAGGFAGIKSYLVRPKLRRRTHSYDFLSEGRGEEYQKAIKDVLGKHRVPAAVTKIQWKNIGRRPAKNIALEVVVPKGYVGYKVDPEDDQTITGPYSVVVKSLQSRGDKILLKQELLIPQASYTLTVEHDGTGLPPSIKFLEDGRDVGESDFDDRVAGGKLETALLIVGLFMVGFILLLALDVVRIDARGEMATPAPVERASSGADRADAPRAGRGSRSGEP